MNDRKEYQGKKRLYDGHKNMRTMLLLLVLLLLDGFFSSLDHAICGDFISLCVYILCSAIDNIQRGAKQKSARARERLNKKRYNLYVSFCMNVSFSYILNNNEPRESDFSVLLLLRCCFFC